MERIKNDLNITFQISQFFVRLIKDSFVFRPKLKFNDRRPMFTSAWQYWHCNRINARQQKHAKKNRVPRHGFGHLTLPSNTLPRSQLTVVHRAPSRPKKYGKNHMLRYLFFINFSKAHYKPLRKTLFNSSLKWKILDIRGTHEYANIWICSIHEKPQAKNIKYDRK